MARQPIKDRVFVFGSNEAGIHGAGAALFAHKEKGMPWGKSYGHYGQAFGIPTKDADIRTLKAAVIYRYVLGFLVYAAGRPKVDFQVTAIGCGLAGFKHKDIAPMFRDAPSNCLFDEAWKPFLYENANYWGTF